MNREQYSKVKEALMDCAAGRSRSECEDRLEAWWRNHVVTASKFHHSSAADHLKFSEVDRDHIYRKIAQELGITMANFGIISKEVVTTSLDEKFGVGQRTEFTVHCLVDRGN